MIDNKIICTLCKCKKVTPIQAKIRNIDDDSCKMYECAECKTHFLYPLPKQEQLQEYYDGKFREEVHTASYYNHTEMTSAFQRFTPEALVRVKRIEQELKPTDNILEIGCSVGYFLKAIVDKVNLAYGTEWDSHAQSYIKEVINDDRIKAATNPQDFNMKFDKIFMFHVLEHIADPISFLDGLKPLLKDGGKIYIEVPNVDDIMVKTFDNIAFKYFYYKKAHLFNFNETGLKYIFENCGFQYYIDFIQRYDISNNFYWLAIGLPGGMGFYNSIFTDKLNEEYANCLIKSKQSDTLFAILQI